MVKLSKKAISAISITSAGLIAGGTVTAAVLIKDNGQQEEEKSTNPCKRDKNYHQYSIVNKIKANDKLSNLIKLEKIDNMFLYIIDEQRFKDNIKSIVYDALQSITIFSKDWSNYELEISYQIEKTNCIKVDVVWYLPNSKVKYFDQFELLLEY